MTIQKIVLTAVALCASVFVFAQPVSNITAQWIGAPWQGEECPKGASRVAPEFYTEFTVDRQLLSAKMMVTGLGFFEAYIDGEKVGDAVLSPNETSYGHREGLESNFIAVSDKVWRAFRVPYLEYDVTTMLQPGKHQLSALVGNGFYASSNKRWVQAYGSPRFLCQLTMLYADGTVDTIVSSPDWLVRKSPIIENDLYAGEIYDASLPVDKWRHAVLRHAPSGRLVLQQGPPDKVIRTIKPKSIVRLSNGDYEVDFGEYISGWLHFAPLQMKKGDTLNVLFPIECPGNGVCKYIAGNDGINVIPTPRFCWWVFQKAIIRGLRPDVMLSIEDVEAQVVHSDVAVSANFSCSDTMLCKLHEIWCRTLADNMHLGTVSDCPHREKGPYTGDGQVACRAAMHSFDMRRLYGKWMQDIADCQDTITGYVPNGAPWHIGCGGGVPWGSAICIMPWQYYLHYADTAMLKTLYPAMRLYVDYLQRWKKQDGTVWQQIVSDPSSGKPNYWMNLGEWCPPYSLPSERLVHTWYYWQCALNTAKAAKVLGNKEECDRYMLKADSAVRAFCAAFYDVDARGFADGGGTKSGEGYGTGTGGGVGDGSNVFALAMMLEVKRLHDSYPHLYMPDSTMMANTIQRLRSELEANAMHLNTGMYATALFFELLCDLNMADEALEVMIQTTFPGFGYWLSRGATTLWEQWNGEDSHNHPMFGGAMTWLYTRLCGMQIDENNPAYRHIIIKPMLAGDVTDAAYSTATPYGMAAVKWHRDPLGLFTLETNVPDGCYATVYMPDGSHPVILTPGARKLHCVVKNYNK